MEELFDFIIVIFCCDLCESNYEHNERNYNRTSQRINESTNLLIKRD